MHFEGEPPCPGVNSLISMLAGLLLSEMIMTLFTTYKELGCQKWLPKTLINIDSQCLLL